MSYCAPNSHARHTILKGCCTTSNVCCDSRSAYNAGKYCECNDTAGNNTTQSYPEALCHTLAGLTGPYVGYTGFYAALDGQTGAYTRFNCGDLHVNVEGVTSVLAATVGNGDIIVTNNPFPVGTYDVTIEERPNHVCAIITIS